MFLHNISSSDDWPPVPMAGDGLAACEVCTERGASTDELDRELIKCRLAVTRTTAAAGPQTAHRHKLSR